MRRAISFELMEEIKAAAAGITAERESARLSLNDAAEKFYEMGYAIVRRQKPEHYQHYMGLPHPPGFKARLKAPGGFTKEMFMNWPPPLRIRIPIYPKMSAMFHDTGDFSPASQVMATVREFRLGTGFTDDDGGPPVFEYEEV